MRFAPPEVFSVFALAASNDPDLPDGRHLRFVPAPPLGPPIAPIAIWRSPAFGLGTLAAPMQAVATNVQAVSAPGNGARVLAASVANGSLAVIDATNATVLQRTPAPAVVAAPRLDRLRLGTAGATVQLYGMFADRSAAVVQSTPPEQLVPLPFNAPTPWYAGAIAPVEAMKRVGVGAPKRRTVLDQPAGPFGPLTPNDEATRVAGAGDANLAQYGKLFAALFAPGDKNPPASRIVSFQQAGGPDEPPSSAELPIWGTLTMQALDYGASRYLGLGATLPVAKVPAPAGTVDAVIALALFALPVNALEEVEPDGTVVKDWVQWPVDPGEDALIARLIALMPNAGLDAVVASAKKAGLTIRAALTAAAVPPPHDPPDVGTVSAGTSRWIAETKGPSVAWQQRFGFGTMPGIATGLAMASTVGGATQSRNTLDGGTGRRQAMLLGRDMNDALIAFDRVESATSATYQFAAADLFGRFGPPRTLALNAPPRPAPPRPVPQVAVERAINLPIDGPASPGIANVVVQVPAIAQLAAGARPITGGQVSLNGVPQASTLAGDTLSAKIALPPLVPMATGSWTISVTFTDGVASSPAADSPLTVADGRTPPVVPSGPGLIWTSRPANAPVTEAALRWPAAPGALFHVYQASAASLLAAAGKSIANPAALSRTAYAQAVLDAAPASGFPRGAFARLTEQPLAADSSGTARFAAALPRAQRTVAFIRVVSVSPNGVESDFAKAALVPLAVPDDLPPPPPRVGLAPSIAAAPMPVAADGKSVRLTIEATGFDLARLAATTPGGAPQFRIRRASGAVDDPLYARVLTAGGALGVEAGKAPSAQFTSAGLQPFVRYTWWAEVRMPAEPAMPPGVTPSATGLTPEFPAWQQAPMPALWSLRSAPFSTIPAPDAAPPPLSASQVKVSPTPGTGTSFTLDLAVTGLPVAAAMAVDVYRLRLWGAVADGSLELLAEMPVTAASLSQQVASPAGKPVRCWIALVDPLGREGPPFKIEPL